MNIDNWYNFGKIFMDARGTLPYKVGKLARVT